MTVPPELLGDPGSVDLTFSGVMQHVQLHGAAVERSHGIRLRASRQGARVLAR